MSPLCNFQWWKSHEQKWLEPPAYFLGRGWLAFLGFQDYMMRHWWGFQQSIYNLSDYIQAHNLEKTSVKIGIFTTIFGALHDFGPVWYLFVFFGSFCYLSLEIRRFAFSKRTLKYLVDCSSNVKLYLAKVQNAFSVCICSECRKYNTLHCCSSNKKSCNNQKMYCEDCIEPRRCTKGVDAENDAIVMMQIGGGEANCASMAQNF